MRLPLKDLVATGPARKIGSTWVVTVARRDGVDCGGDNVVVTFRTKGEAVAFAAERISE